MRRAFQFAAALLAILLVVQAAYSLRWPIAHDEAPLLYESFLIREFDKVPYRDIFDFQMPGSMALYAMIGGLTHEDAAAVRTADLLVLSLILLFTFLSIKRFGKTAAFLAAVLFGLKYLQGGPSMSLQREYLLLVFLSPAVWIVLQESRGGWQRFLLGFLFGAAACIKPHAAIGLLPIVLFDLTDLVRRRGVTVFRSIAMLVPTATGFLLPLLAAVAWLAANGALAPFLEIALNYWPLYAQINGAMTVLSGTERFTFLLDQVWRMGGHGLWLLPAACAIFIRRDSKVYLLASLAFCYALYPAFSGQFFPYHYIPFTYLAVMLAALCIPDEDFPQSWTKVAAPALLAVVLLLTVRPSTAFLRQLEGKRVATSTARSAEIAEFLADNLQPGDTVQPLDWTGGALQAMLETRAPIATSYVFDFYFYHHVSTSYIQTLRADFMRQMRSAPPAFVVEVTAADKPWVDGEDTTREFPELREFLALNYSVTIQTEDYRIHQRK